MKFGYNKLVFAGPDSSCFTLVELYIKTKHRCRGKTDLVNKIKLSTRKENTACVSPI